MPLFVSLWYQEGISNVNFTIMDNNANKTYLGNIINNCVTKTQTFDKTVQGIEKLGIKWIQENIGIHGRAIVAKNLLTAKISHRSSVNGISLNMKAKSNKKIKDSI